jgi:hypothetical protein
VTAMPRRNPDALVSRLFMFLSCSLGPVRDHASDRQPGVSTGSRRYHGTITGAA